MPSHAKQRKISICWGGDDLQVEIKISTGETSESVQIQVSKLVKSFGYDDRKAILEQANIQPSEIIAEEMVAMKVDLGIPWEKMKTMGR